MKKGYVLKSGKYVSKKRESYLEIEQGVIHYQQDKTGKGRKTISLDGCDVGEVPNSDTEFCVRPRGNSRAIVFDAKTSEERTKWLATLKEAAGPDSSGEKKDKAVEFDEEKEGTDVVVEETDLVVEEGGGRSRQTTTVEEFRAINRRVKKRAAKTARLSVISGYNQWADVYDTEANPLIALDIKKYPEKIVRPVVKGQVVVDLGCGTGRNIDRMLNYGAERVIGLDISEGMLTKAAERYPQEEQTKILLTQDLESKGVPDLSDDDRKSYEQFVHLGVQDLGKKFPLADNSVAAVTTCLVLEHCPIDILTHIFSEVNRILKPQGIFVVTEMHPFASTKEGRSGDAQFKAKDGTKIKVTSHKKHISCYLSAAIEANLTLIKIGEECMDAGTGRDAGVRGEEFIGQPLLLWYIVQNNDKE